MSEGELVGARPLPSGRFLMASSSRARRLPHRARQPGSADELAIQGSIRSLASLAWLPALLEISAAAAPMDASPAADLRPRRVQNGADFVRAPDRSRAAPGYRAERLTKSYMYPPTFAR